MATLPYQNPKMTVDFIGAEGSQLGKLRSDIPGENQNSPNLLSDEDLLRQISVAREIEAQRGLQPYEAEQLSNLLAVQKGRTQQANDLGQQQIDKIFGGGGAPAAPGAGGGFNVDDYIKDLGTSAANQRSALGTIFGARQQAGVQNLNDIFGAQRGQQIEEEAALGRLRSPASAASIGAIDAQKNKALTDFITGLQGEQGTASVNLENSLANQISQGRQFGANYGAGQQDLGLREKLGKAGLVQQGSQFGQTFGLEQEKFGEQRRRTALEDLFNRDSLAQADKLGKMQADAADDGVIGDIAKLTGGVGALLGGVGNLKNSFKPKTAGTY